MNDAIAIKQYKVISEFVSKDADDFYVRFYQIAQAALHRAKAAEAFLRSGVKNAADFHSGAFFQQLVNQKVLHRRIIEKISPDFECAPFAANEDMPEPLDMTISPGDQSVSKTAELRLCLREIFEIVYEKALDELDFYLNFLLVEKHPVMSSLLQSLANLAKDYLFEVKLRYLEHQSQIEMDNPKKIVEDFYKLEHRYN
jgi:hypothetical protein